MRGDPVPLTGAALIRAVFLRALLICLTLCAPVGAEPLTELDWQAPDPQLGGLSGVEISRDGARLWLLSDRGFLIAARVRRTEGRITAVEITQVSSLLDTSGNRAETRLERDSEGLAVSAGGAIYVSYEGEHRVVRHMPDGRVNLNLPSLPDMGRLEENGSFEALAIDPDDRLYTLIEGGRNGPAPLFRFVEGHWDTRFVFPRSNGFDPVGMDIDDAGRLYVLERRFRVLGRFATRIRRAPITATGLGVFETVLQTPSGRHPNLEGISLWRDGDNRLIATLVSDDNFSSMFRNQIVEYVLPD
ncbi:esterase-like activity of phytase family protein [Rhodophyticola sp. CCM32]|uniref:esterase-like activity of phytase family protein n=1 Tax=Rhodophyticola sp. CCM32 TaxID=2916397 RepID=UPI00143D81EF|nr:esterase-like activity of phytase family protein [Rhodophyticola sp. CCM32]